MKKILVLFLAFVAALNIATTAFAAEKEETDSFKLNLAYDMGILTEDDSGDRLPEEEMTRIQALITVYRLMNFEDIENVPPATKQYYSDMDIYHYGAGYAQKMTENGFINGYDDGTYGADKPVTLGELTAILLRTAGYSRYFDLTGKAPYEAARELGLLKSVKLGESDAVKRRDAAMIFYNLMFIKTLKAVNSIGSSITYDDGGEYINEVLGLEYDDGIIDGIGGASLIGDIADGYVSVNGKTYGCGNYENQSYLGYKVRIFYNPDNDSAVSIIPDDKNKTVCLDAEDIEKYEGNTYYVSKSGGASHYSIDRAFDAAYNCRPVFDDKYMTCKYGSVTLIDNDFDNRYDAVVISSYESYIAEGYSAGDELIIMKNKDSDGKNIRIELKEYDVCKTENSYGESAELSSIISQDTVLTVQRSLDKKFIFISAVGDRFKGTIKSVSEDGEKKKYVIGDKTYEATNNCYIPNGSDFLGSRADIYLDKSGHIAAIIKSEDSEGWKYGYIKYAWADDSSDRAMVRVFTENGSLSDIYCSEKLILDGEKISSPTHAARLIAASYDDFENREINGYTSEIHTKRLLRYYTDKNGIITKIDTPVEHGLYDISVPENFSSDNCLMIRVKGYIYWKNAMKMFKTVMKAHMDIEGDIIGEDDMKVFTLPNDTLHENDREYSVKTLGQSSFSETYYYACGYNTSVESTECTVMALRSKLGNSARKIMIVGALGEKVNGEGDAVKAVSGYLGTTYTQLPVQENSFDTSSLKRGDVIFYDYVDGEMIINDIGYSADKAGVLDSDDAYHPDDGGIHFNIPYRVLKAKITRLCGMRMQVTPLSQATEMMALPSAVIIYDSKTDDMTVGTIYDVRTEESYGNEADTVFISTRSGNIDEMVAVR